MIPLDFEAHLKPRFKIRYVFTPVELMNYFNLFQQNPKL